MSAVILFDQVRKHYGRTVALDGLDLRVEEGQVHGFLGPNGSGKTTTMRVLLGMLGITSGRVEVFGLEPRGDVASIHARLAYVPGDVVLWPNLTGGETLDVLGRLHGRGGDRTPWLDLFDLDPTKRNRTYSKGNRQKVALVAAFATDAELLILDEPTSGLDPLIERAFAEAVRSERSRGENDPVVEPHPERSRATLRLGEHHSGRLHRRLRTAGGSSWRTAHARDGPSGYPA